MTVHQQTAELREVANSFGFNRVFFTKVHGAAGIDAYDSFLSKGHHGKMSWMVRSRPPRANPKLLLPSARSIMVLGLDYWHPRPTDPGGATGMVSRYAWGRDYHNLIGKRLRRMTKELMRSNGKLKCYFGVDSRPIIERAWAQQSGVGFIGKNCMIIAPGDSSFFFLAAILLNVDTVEDFPIVKNHCGRCRRCLDVCPTNAFIGAQKLDARKCISYLTIEHPGVIPTQFREKIGRWFFGCDLCQEVCPHNHKPSGSLYDDFAPRNAWIDLEWILNSEDEVIADHFIGTPLRRSGPFRLKRNAAIVLGNLRTGRAALLKTRERGCDLLREHIDWSLDRIG